MEKRQKREHIVIFNRQGQISFLSTHFYTYMMETHSHIHTHNSVVNTQSYSMQKAQVPALCKK